MAVIFRSQKLVRVLTLPGIREMIKKGKKQNLPLIFFSTYNSAERIQGSYRWIYQTADFNCS